MEKGRAAGSMAGERPVRLGNLIGYGLGDIYGGGAMLIVGMLFLFFLTEVAGLKPALAGLMFGLGKVWDGISDPLMGWLSDRTRSRAGRRRIYFLWGIVPIALSFALLWLPIRSDSQALLFSYYLLAYILLDAALTMVMTPYSALPAEMSSDFRTRNLLSTSRLVFSGLASLVAAIVPKLIIDAFPGDPGRGHLAMGAAFGLLFALPWIIVYRSTWERADARPPEGGGGFLRDFLSIFRNRSFRVHFAMYVLAFTAMDILMALFSYYLGYYLGRPGLYSLAMGSLMVAQLAAMPAWAALANRRGPALAYGLGLGIWALGMALTRGLGPESPALAIAAVCGLIGAGTSAGVFASYAILPFVVDVDELLTGEQRSGAYAGAMTLLRKLAQGLFALPAIGFMLQGIGFQPGRAQEPAVLGKFFAFFIGAPGALILLGILASTRFRITPGTHAVLRAELARLRAGGRREEAGAEARAVGELLSGRPSAGWWRGR